MMLHVKVLVQTRGGCEQTSVKKKCWSHMSRMDSCHFLPIDMASLAFCTDNQNLCIVRITCDYSL